MRSPSKILLAAAAVLFGLAPITACAAVEGSFERTLQVTGPVTLEVTTGSGDITLRRGDDGSVRILGRIHARGADAQAKLLRLQEQPPIEQNGNSIRIGHIEDESLRRNVSISYELVVPRTTDLKARTGSGDQNIGGIAGPVEASSGSGSVILIGIGSKAVAQTGSGDIRLQELAAEARAQTGSGSIVAEGVGGAFTGQTGSGDVKVSQSAAGDVDIETGSGSVQVSGVRGALSVRTGSGDVRAQGEATGDWSLRAGSGDITVDLPDQAAFELDARTSSGSLDIGQPVTVQGRIARNTLRGTVRGGGVLLTLRSGSGDIHVQ